MTDRHIFWTPWDEPGLEHLQLSIKPNEIVADGLVIRVAEKVPYRLSYRIVCNVDWRVRQVEVRRLDGDHKAWQLVSDGAGSWQDHDGKSLPELAGCIDVDILATPFTNTLPIRRLKLELGTAETIKVVYFDVPVMKISVMPQLYTCLEAGNTESGGVYEFKSLEDGFTARLPVDGDGLVLDYPELFRRTGQL